jgi:hypothetical protein
MHRFSDLAHLMIHMENRGRALKLTFNGQSIIIESLDHLSLLPCINSDLELSPIPYNVDATEVGLYSWASKETTAKPTLRIKIANIKVEEVDPEEI